MVTEAEMRLHRVCFTGHRPEKLDVSERKVVRGLEKAIDAAIADGYCTFITGMARGVDIWAAEIIIQRKKKNTDLMYDNAENKTTAIHMFGIKYGQIIKNYALQVTAIVEASGLSSNYHVEVSKGIRIYESISNNEFGVKFYSSDDAIVESCVSEKTLPVLKPRARTLYSLNNILYGAPGTGKTYSTAQYAVAIADCKPLSVIQKTERKQLMARYNELISDGRIVFTTFHQNYGYEDFIQGIRPDTTAETMSFRTVDGVFKVIAEKAMAHPELDYIIIIDEINRANISKVFGELITLIENDKRWGEVNAIDATLPSGEIFAVPNNLYIIGTMNSADKSISLIDTALRRRFDFVEFEPNAELILDSELRKVLIKLNEGISAELGSTDLLIGHSYFMGKTIEDLCDVMNRNVIPMLLIEIWIRHIFYIPCIGSKKKNRVMLCLKGLLCLVKRCSFI